MAQMNPEMVTQHKIADMHANYTDEQFAAFKKDIEKNGQLLPVILYRNKLVDGRHRLRAIKELGIKTIDYIILPNNLTIDEVKTKVLSTDNRRHLTPTQLAIKAYSTYIEGKAKGMTQDAAQSLVGAKKSNFKHVVNIIKYKRPDLVDLLSKGSEVNIGSEIIPVWSSSLSAVVMYLSKEAELAKPPVDTSSLDSVTEDAPIVINKKTDAAELTALLQAITSSYSKDTVEKAIKGLV